MTKINLDIDKNKKYVVACSFGPDSMALLHLCIVNKVDIVVAHVNYRKRPEAIEEQHKLERYCERNGLKIYILDLLKVHSQGNFQSWARDQRYKFFAKVLKTEKADAVLVAHQQDDLLETYLMQKNRGNLVKNPGISDKNSIFGATIIRPLLNYTKKQLQQYDEENLVPFATDSSNLTDDYERNRIRHHVVEELTNDQRINLLKEIELTKSENVEPKTKFTKNEFLSLSYERIVRILDYYMEQTKTHRDLSKKFINEVKKAFLGNITAKFDITDLIRLELDYDEVYIINMQKIKKYVLTFEKTLKNEFLDIDFSKGTGDRKFNNMTNRYVIKNMADIETTIITNYNKPINRLFIDWKMPHFLREVWPALLDEDGKILYIPRYRKMFQDNHESKLIIDVDYFLEF